MIDTPSFVFRPKGRRGKWHQEDPEHPHQWYPLCGVGPIVPAFIESRATCLVDKQDLCNRCFPADTDEDAGLLTCPRCQHPIEENQIIGRDLVHYECPDCMLCLYIVADNPDVVDQPTFVDVEEEFYDRHLRGFM
jgi:hypothetical protein